MAEIELYKNRVLANFNGLLLSFSSSHNMFDVFIEYMETCVYMDMTPNPVYVTLSGRTGETVMMIYTKNTKNTFPTS